MNKKFVNEKTQSTSRVEQDKNLCDSLNTRQRALLELGKSECFFEKASRTPAFIMHADFEISVKYYVNLHSLKVLAL